MKDRASGDLTLEQLEGTSWPEPSFDSHLVRTCHELRRKPIRDLSPSDLRILIQQAVSLEHLVPLALARLERAPLLEAEFFEGDLLGSLLRVGTAFWSNHPNELARLQGIVARIDELPTEVAEALRAHEDSGV